MDSMCGKSIEDLRSLLQQDGITTSLVSGTARQDWLTLAMAPRLFCSPSTFCIAAAFANRGGHAYLGFNPGKTAVTGPTPTLGVDRLWTELGMHWVETDFIGGKE